MRGPVSGRFAFPLQAAILCAACSESSSSNPEDGGSNDSASDALSTDASIDGSVRDGGNDGGRTDGKVRPSNDGATDAAEDAALDAGPEAEAGPTVACVKGDLLCIDGGVVQCGPGGDWDGAIATCPSGTTCSGNRCSLTLIENAGQINALVLDHGDFFWVNGWFPQLSGQYPFLDAGNATIMTAPVEGGAPQQIGMVVGEVAGFTATNAVAYVSETATRQIVAFPKDGSGPRVFADAGGDPFALATDGTNLYWCFNAFPTPIVSAPLAGGPSKSFAQGQDGIDDLAVANGTIFWGTYTGTGGVIGSAPTSGGPGTTLASTYDTDVWLVSDGVNVYWVGWGASSGDVWQMSIDGGTAVNLATNQGGPYGIAVDDASVFWTTGGSVQKVSISGGHISTIAAGQSGASSVIVDQSYVYWANNGAGTIARAPK